MADARRSAAAGVLYPAERDDLARAIDDLLGAARRARSATRAACPRALVLPHGPYDVAGAVAASGWARVAASGSAGRVARVVVLGPAHHAPFRGVAAPFDDVVETPLGSLAIDRILIETVRSLPRFVISDAPHDQESSVEVHLPFAQTVLGSPAIVPLVVGDQSDEEAAAVLERLWRDDVLVVVSADLSRYHEAARARRLDESTAAAIERLDDEAIGDDHVCGASALRALLRVARARSLRATRLDLRHCGSAEEMVGFGAFALG